MRTSVRLYMFAAWGDARAAKRRNRARISRGAGERRVSGIPIAVLAERPITGSITRLINSATSMPPRGEEGSATGAIHLPRGLLPQPPVRRLRRERPDRAGVRPPTGQKVRHLIWHTDRNWRRPRRDCKVRGRLCKLSSTSHRHAGRLHPRGGSSTVEPQSSKLMTRVRFSSAASSSGQLLRDGSRCRCRWRSMRLPPALACPGRSSSRSRSPAAAARTRPKPGLRLRKSPPARPTSTGRCSGGCRSGRITWRPKRRRWIRR